jgi:Rps23 Pro-64 3,4-dihydroxylase Tpa1-like proline 4-hydroxylase
MNIVDRKYENLVEVAKQYCSEYKNAKPFPNIVFENFFDTEMLDNVLSEFPDLSIGKASIFDNPNEKKLAGKGNKRFGKITKKFMKYLNSEEFLQFLQLLTGIDEKLIADKKYSGGGLHEIKRGGLLKIHVDFNKHSKTKLDRRLNVLIYLNKNWKEEYGGHLELWNKSMDKCEKKILPAFNTMAIFSTTDYSFHGHPNPLNCPDSMSRKSLALYYYSDGRPQSEIDSGISRHGTIFKARKNSDDDKLSIKETAAD